MSRPPLTDERAFAAKLADRVLDKPWIDPDGDICVLARQLLRSEERTTRAEAEVLRLRSALQAVANMENSPMGMSYELPRVLADVRAGLATPASQPLARQEE